MLNRIKRLGFYKKKGAIYGRALVIHHVAGVVKTDIQIGRIGKGCAHSHAHHERLHVALLRTQSLMESVEVPETCCCGHCTFFVALGRVKLTINSSVCVLPEEEGVPYPIDRWSGRLSAGILVCAIHFFDDKTQAPTCV